VRIPLMLWIILGCRAITLSAQSSCSGIAKTPAVAADCAARAIPIATAAVLDSNHTYSLAELIDFAEHNNPRTRAAWEGAKQRAKDLGVEKSAYFPVVVFQAIAGDQRDIVPEPEPFPPRGYVVVESPIVQPALKLQYLLFDFGRRGARVDTALAEKVAAGAAFIQVNQDVAFHVASAYYRLLDAQERLQATRETLKTAQTTQDAAEAQLSNGRATLPDVLNARAETSQAVFDLESADGDEKIARVLLAEEVGAEPSPNVSIISMNDAPLPESISSSIEELIARAMAARPDLAAQAAEIRAADDRVRLARSEYRPRVTLSGTVAQTSIWPSADYGQLGKATETTWSGALAVEWKVFDGGARRNQLEAAESKRREAQDDLTERRNKATREVWAAYIAFRTALRRQQAAVSLLEAANESYSASLEAYRYGVKNLIDVVTAERQLARARLSGVSARSQVFLGAVDLEHVTGNLLRTLPPATTLHKVDGPRK
jgi:outer membrane protein